MCALAQVLVSDPKELEKIREREFDITKERIQMVLRAGANVVFTTKARARSLPDQYAHPTLRPLRGGPSSDRRLLFGR